MSSSNSQLLATLAYKKSSLDRQSQILRLLCFESNSDGELTAYKLKCGVTYGIEVFDKEVVLFKSFYAKSMVLESFSLDLMIIFTEVRWLPFDV
jgi:hypothetical protein